MTIRQKVLKAVYPLFAWVNQIKTTQKYRHNTRGVVPPVSFYDLSVLLNDGTEFSFAKLRGKNVLLVNTASDCGYTPQYAELQTLYRHSGQEIEIVALPANDFKNQEQGSDEEISRFCSVNYGTSFLLTKKAVVKKSSGQHPVYQWLTDPQQNGWNSKAPSWNFAKYLVNEQGVLTHYFEPAVSPLSSLVRSAIRT